MAGAAPNPRQWLVAALVAISSAFFPLPPQKGVVT
jgi:hypothetical protein